ncbi:Alkaline phosphatase precursor [Pseudobythopirellula maris]|uniref:Alkaline phosphatase n=2 Tax=Pseudobythopirellula maris TaxID=2527991 RepID=A0A5C5ZKT9_9BACT|nr:Alkaline phosphatase precursor [Pseudobythopirellula maris]
MLSRSLLVCTCLLISPACLAGGLRDMQSEAVASKHSEAAHWGPDPDLYSSWTSHSNRLIPVYTYGTKGAGDGIDLASYTGEHSPYRDRSQIQRLYRSDSADSVDPSASYMDQTNIFDLQLAALEAGRKHIFVVVFDGMDWQTTRAASTWNLRKVAYNEGRGVGAHFQDYQADGSTQFGWMVTSPFRDGAQVDPSSQTVKNPGSGLPGGYSASIAGLYPWSTPATPEYLVAGPKDAAVRHAYTDSAASATSMFCGVKSYNGAIGVDGDGRLTPSIAHLAQARGYMVGAVTSVPISHATPACAYGHNVSRGDYQDITRDLLGLPSVSHPDEPLSGLDVLIGCGHGVEKLKDNGQGDNFTPGNRYLTQQDLRKCDVAEGGRYVVAQRTAEVAGGESLLDAAQRAVATNTRLFGFYGVSGPPSSIAGNLPYASADGNYDPAPGVDDEPIEYSEADIEENPTLAEMTSAALTVLEANGSPFWLMTEAGDVDWANHDNNLDASIGAVNSGDAAVRVITDWVERNSNWDESLLIVTADHGHYLVLDAPELLIQSKK